MKDYLSPGASIATIINAQMKDYTNKPITVSVGEENSTKCIKTVHPSCSSMYTLSPSEPRESISYPYRSKNSSSKSSNASTKEDCKCEIF